MAKSLVELGNERVQSRMNTRIETFESGCILRIFREILGTELS